MYLNVIRSKSIATCILVKDRIHSIGVLVPYSSPPVRLKTKLGEEKDDVKCRCSSQ